MTEKIYSRHPVELLKFMYEITGDNRLEKMRQVVLEKKIEKITLEDIYAFFEKGDISEDRAAAITDLSV